MAVRSLAGDRSISPRSSFLTSPNEFSVRRHLNAQHPAFVDDETVHEIVGRRLPMSCASREAACHGADWRVRLVMSSLISAIASLFPSEASGSMSGFSS
jgi:hypothetical protein